MEEKKKTKILNYINVFRALAILLIIMGHTMQFGANGSIAHKAICEAVCGGTAAFVFISGFLFQHLSYKYEFKNYMKKKRTNVIMPYLITSIPGLLFCFYCPVLYGNVFYKLPCWIQIPLHLSIGRVHNVPSWFILMIVIFFLFSRVLLKLEEKKILYKLLPVLFLLTLFVQRFSPDIEGVGQSYIVQYLIYLKYIFVNFIHFSSMYVFGMYCSANKEIIDVFWNKRLALFVLMIITSVSNIMMSYLNLCDNGTISKIFFTMLLLGILKHYDENIMLHTKINKAFDVIAKYSFGLFFVHWYWFFIYNRLFNLNKVLPVENGYICTFLTVSVRFVSVAALSMLTLYLLKKLLLKIKPDVNTREFLGV